MGSSIHDIDVRIWDAMRPFVDSTPAGVVRMPTRDPIHDLNPDDHGNQIIRPYEQPPLMRPDARRIAR